MVRWKLFVLMFTVLMVGCNGNPNKPTPVDQTPPPLSTGGPSHTIVQVVAGSVPGTMTVHVWGNVKLMLADQPEFGQNPATTQWTGDSLSGGTVLVRDYSCGSRSTGRGAYANDAPRQNSDTTTIKDLPICGGRVDIEIVVETFKHAVIQHTLAPPTEIRGNNLRVVNRRIVGNL